MAGKRRRQARLPLPQEGGDAILHDLAPRPHVHPDQVFLTTRAPCTRLSYHAVGTMATQALARAGTETPIHGAHGLRHAAAPQMLRNGLAVSAIGAVLRHAAMETTAGYATVEVPLLQAVVPPWPEVPACGRPPSRPRGLCGGPRACRSPRSPPLGTASPALPPRVARPM